MNKKIKMTLFAVFFFTAGLIAAFSCNNMVYGNIPGPDAEKPGAVASFGIKTKPSQILLLAEKFRKVFVMFDDDPQARKSSEAIGYDLSMCGVDVEICLIDGDPGGLGQKTADKYMDKLLG